MAQTIPPNTDSSERQNNVSETNGSQQDRQDPTTQSNLKEKKFFKKIRSGLMIVAILAAGSTFQAGLNPPGGFWPDDDPQRNIVAGTPILHDRYFRRYQAFFYCNAISFLSSLAIIISLMNETFFNDPRKIKALKFTMVLDLFTFMAAYAAGSCRLVSSSIYVFVLMGVVFVYVFCFAWKYSVLQDFVARMPCTGRRRRNAEQNHQSAQV